MKVLGTCYPNDIWFQNLRTNQSSKWFGQGIWSVLFMTNLSKNLKNLEIVTDLSPSNFTHPILQTVIDGKVDLVPLEVGMTSQRHGYLKVLLFISIGDGASESFF